MAKCQNVTVREERKESYDIINYSPEERTLRSFLSVISYYYHFFIFYFIYFPPPFSFYFGEKFFLRSIPSHLFWSANAKN